jgi:outer membrane protein assembly factor BamD
MKKLHSILFFTLLVLTSCSTYTKVVKSDDYDRKFELANEMYDTKKWVKAITLYEQVYQRAPKTGQGELAFFRIGKAYYFEENFYLGGYYLNSFYEKFPFSPKAEEARFLGAMCSVNNSPNHSLDQTETELALNELQMFINKYPQSPLVDTCNVVMDKLRFKMELKDFEAVRLYHKMENYKSSTMSAEVFLSKYPRSTFREEGYYILLVDGYKLAMNSVEDKKNERIEKAIERYRTFAIEFPESKRKKEMEGNLQRLLEEQKLVTNTKN